MRDQTGRPNEKAADKKIECPTVNYKGITAVFCIWWLIVCIVSAFDVYWIVRNQDVLLECEQNPVGVWLIQLDDGRVALFMAVKFFGTALVLSITPLIFLYARKFGYAIMCGLAAFMSGLFYYLHWG